MSSSPTDITSIQHQIDRLRQEMEKNAAENNELRIRLKKNLAEERIHKRDEAEILYKKLPFLKNKTNVLKMRLKINKQ